MKQAKDIIYEFIQHYIYSQNDSVLGVETSLIAKELNMQRSNVSSALNKLVSENKLTKTNTRPVLYNLPVQTSSSSESYCFAELIGENGSLRNAVLLAKAAILYPQKSLNVIVSAKIGCGTSYFVSLMHKFAIQTGLLNSEAPFIKVNCRYFLKNIAALDDELFNSDNNLFKQARGGVLLIEYFDLLDVKQQNRIFNYLDTKIIEDKNGVSQVYDDVYLVLSCNNQAAETYIHKLPVHIELPELKNRPITEKLDLINHFFNIEARNSNRNIEVTTEAIKALLLTDFSYNVKELNHEIMSACASAYVRVVHDLHKNVYVCINDLQPKIKKALIKLKDHYYEIDSLLKDSEYVIYDQHHGLQTIKTDKNLYDSIQTQYKELSDIGINQTSIETVINDHIKGLFNKYSYKYDNESNNYEQLSKIVDENIIKCVKNFFESYKNETGKNIKTNIFYGLCLHIGSLVNKMPTYQRITNDQIVHTIQNYPKEYAASTQFASILKKEIGLELNVSEVAIITMFLVEPEDSDDSVRPVLLYIMHGNSTASSLAQVTNSLTHCENAYAYDLKLDADNRKAIEEIKELILTIDRGAGVLVVYDMGSIQTMLNTISEEVSVKIRYMNYPITLAGIDIARKCSMESDIDTIFHTASQDISNFVTKNYGNKRNNVIITLCHTGEGGALQLKNYIDQYSKLGMKTIALSISNREELISEVLNIKKIYNIHAFVGTYDPKILGVPFISIVDVFANSSENLDRILQFVPNINSDINYDQVYVHLEEQLKYASITKLKAILPQIVDELSVMYSLDTNQILGIFVHIACVIEYIIAGNNIRKNDDTNNIINKFPEDYKAISKLMKKLEKEFKIIIDDNEIAMLIVMVKKL
ncbi:MAG: PRD domain-containing protein [Erysipelotrichaceae bacterium]|nr:PRD domain-containing protein [Erysipelotrichaceae bacterium]MDY5252921.1 PRD domain-containing protein [Erysipelotrichaceae bacterium]